MFKIGDIVQLKKGVVSGGPKQGNHYVVVRIDKHENCSIRVKAYNGTDTWSTNGYGTYPHYLEYISECNKCIYVCKTKKKCPLFTDTPPPFIETGK